MSKVLCIRKDQISGDTMLGGLAKTQLVLTTVLSTAEYQDKKDTEHPVHDFAQIIPYVVITRHTTRGKEALAYVRSVGETRLRDKWSIGFGGHIDSNDAAAYADGGSSDHQRIDKIIQTAISRELDEELMWPAVIGDLRSDLSTLTRRVACLWCPVDPVSCAHFGLLYELNVNKNKELMFHSNPNPLNVERGISSKEHKDLQWVKFADRRSYDWEVWSHLSFMLLENAETIRAASMINVRYTTLREFTAKVGESTFVFPEGSPAYVKQVDENNKKVLIDFGDRKSFWISSRELDSEFRADF